MARWHATNNNYEAALDRLIHARALNGSEHRERFLVLEHHLLTALGHFDEADALFETFGAESPDMHLMQANLRLRQAAVGALLSEQADKERLELTDWIFRLQSLVPISELVSDDRFEFVSLNITPTANEAGSSSSEPVVSIVMPAYNAEATLALAVNSLRAQSFPHLEILIVNDASADDTEAVAKALAAEDSRIRVIDHGRNLGAYAARNTGLKNATGTYFTVHDADDWSHPQMIELQLKPLVEERAVGSFSRLARVSSELEFLLRPFRPMLEPIHWNYMSLLTETQKLRQLGGWDAVRAHSDSELIERMRQYYGNDSLSEVETSVPLTFCRVTSENITTAKSTSLRSVDFGARREYSEQARFWRSRAFAEGEIPSYAEHERTDAKSPFYCARSLATNPDRISRSYDLVLGSDLALTGGTRRCNLAYLDCARRLGLRVGIFNMPRYRTRGTGTIDSAYRELFQLDGIDLLTPGDDVSAGTVIVHHPPVLRNLFDGYPNVKSANHYLLVNQLPWVMKDYTDVQYDTTRVIEHFDKAFGAEPSWIPISPKVREYLGRVLPEELIHHEDWYPVVSWDAAPVARAPRAGESKPVIGRHSRDHATKWPETVEMLEKAYLAGTDYEVRLLGGVRAAEKVLGYRPSNWVVYPFDSLSADEFLSSIDIFIHYHHSLYIEEFGRNVAEAMAQGVPCILPPEYRETFMDGAVYAEPDELEDAIQAIWANRDEYVDFSNRGISFVEKYCGPDDGMRRIAGLVE